MDTDINQYFTSYEDLEIHQLMLEDAPRTEAYKEAILSNSQYFKDKVVMDVGCGTGILSVFCAQAGAKKVFAVEASNLANLAKDVVKENKYEDIIEVIHSKVEDVVLPENIKVDVIVSEWMGFYLLHEGMLDSVLVARDKFLKEFGHIFPESATIYVAPCSIPSLYKKWDNVHGVSMQSFAKSLRVSKGEKPEILALTEENIIGDKVALCWIDLKEDKIEDLDLYTVQHVVAAKKAAPYQGVCVWFDCTFPALSQGDDKNVILSTDPANDPTHWKQTLLVLPEEQLVEEGEPIAFQLEMKRNGTNSRRYNLQLTLLDPENTEHPIPCYCHMTKCILAKTYMEYQDGGILEDCSIDDDDR